MKRFYKWCSQKCRKDTQKTFLDKWVCKFFLQKVLFLPKVVPLQPNQNKVNMSQRLQSIFFFLSAILFALLFFLPLAVYYGETNILNFNVFGVESSIPGGESPYPTTFSLPVLILSVTAILLSGYLAMGLFRAVKLSQFIKLQKIARIDIVVIVAWVAVVFAYYIRVVGNPIGATPAFRVGAFLPLPALIMVIAATSGLSKDIKKVRSTDRIR